MFLIEKQGFEKGFKGHPTGLYTLRNANNVHVLVTNYGARWVSMLVQDRNQNFRDVVVGFDSLEGYLSSSEAYYGATVGRYANRIAKGRFNLGDKKYTLAINNPPNHLHGGPHGFHNVAWGVIHLTESSISMRYESADGEEGYPGKLTVDLVYTLSADNSLEVEFKATSDADTIINLTNHAFFNLNGEGAGDVLGHVLQINGDHYTPVDATSIPLGSIEPVGGTAFDFRAGKMIGADINAEHQQLHYGNGYDHNFVLNTGKEGWRHAATAIGDITSIQMEVWTTEPGLQLYTGNFMKGENIFKTGAKDNHRNAFCLETQHFPDSPNQPGFPSTLLPAGEVFYSKTAFKFSVAK